MNGEGSGEEERAEQLPALVFKEPESGIEGVLFDAWVGEAENHFWSHPNSPSEPYIYRQPQTFAAKGGVHIQMDEGCRFPSDLQVNLGTLEKEALGMRPMFHLLSHSKNIYQRSYPWREWGTDLGAKVAACKIMTPEEATGRELN